MKNLAIQALKAIQKIIDFSSEKLSSISNEKRDAIGDIATVISAIFLNVFSVPLVIFVENYQAKKGGFDIEIGDIERRTFIASATSVFEVMLYFAW